MQLPENIILIDKPVGVSSFDVVRRIRKKVGVRKVGHAGTLDPLASGLLVVGVGKGTKKLNQFLKLPKTYGAAVLLGERRTTGDMEGDVVEERAVAELDEERVRKMVENISGVHTLPVPAYSAVKEGGQPLYKRARRGEEVIPPKKKMEIISCTLHSIEREGDRVVLRLVMEVGSGAYVRSIAEEMGRQLGYPAVVKELRRTRVGEYGVEEAQSLEEVTGQSIRYIV